LDRSYQITGSTCQTNSFKIKKIGGIKTLRYKVEVETGIAYFKWEKENEYIYFLQILKMLITDQIVLAIKIPDRTISIDYFNNSEEEVVKLIKMAKYVEIDIEKDCIDELAELTFYYTSPWLPDGYYLGKELYRKYEVKW